MDQQENEAVFRRFYEVLWNEGDLAVADELLSEDFVNHELGDDVPPPHRELYKQGVLQTRSAYPDWWLVIEELRSEGDRVNARWRAGGTHTGELEDVAPTGKREEFVGTTTVRVVDGKIVEFSKQQSEALDR
jgi:predicted ester cyclase